MSSSSSSDTDSTGPSTPRDKIVLLGARGVGKHSLRQQYTHGVFGQAKRESRKASSHKTVTTGGTTGIAEIECVRYLHESGRHSILDNLDGADVFLVVYSVTSRSSFETALEAYAWLQWLHWSGRPGAPSVPVTLVGNKKDLESWREVSVGEGRRAARELGVDFVELSAKDGPAVTALLDGAVRTSRQRQGREAGVSSPDSMRSVGYGGSEYAARPRPSMAHESARTSRSRMSRISQWRRSMSLGSRHEFGPAWDAGTDHGKTQLQDGLVAAAKANDARDFESYARAGALLDGRAKGEKGSVVHIAAAAGHLAILAVVIQRQGGINLPDLDGIPPLQLAAVHGHYDCVDLLLKSGGDIDQTSPRYGTALSAAASRGHADIVRLLLYMGAGIDVEGSSAVGNMMQRLSRSFDATIVQFLREFDDDATTTCSLSEESPREVLSRDGSEMTLSLEPRDTELAKIEEVEDVEEADSIYHDCDEEDEEDDEEEEEETVRYSQDSLLEIVIPTDSFEIGFSDHGWFTTKAEDSYGPGFASRITVRSC